MDGAYEEAGLPRAARASDRVRAMIDPYLENTFLLLFRMPISLDPKLNNPSYSTQYGLSSIPDQVEPDRKMTNMTIGMVMLANLARSIARHAPTKRFTDNVADQVKTTMDKARKRAKETGKSLDTILRMNEEALRANKLDSKFVLDKSSNSNQRSNATTQWDRAKERELDAQDERRKAYKPSYEMELHASVLEQQERLEEAEMDAALGIEPMNPRPELLPPSHVSTDTRMVRRPAPRENFGREYNTQTPNADRLRYNEAPGRRETKEVFRLKHNPSGGGGMHNPHEL